MVGPNVNAVAAVRQLPDHRVLAREALFVARRLSGVATARCAFGAQRKRKLPREDDVFFRPGVDLLAMRASQLVILQRRVRVEIFIDRETRRSELRCGGASD